MQYSGDESEIWDYASLLKEDSSHLLQAHALILHAAISISNWCRISAWASKTQSKQEKNATTMQERALAKISIAYVGHRIFLCGMLFVWYAKKSLGT